MIAAPATEEAILVDPVLEQVERDRLLLQELGLTLRYLEIHIHAEHITGTGIQETTGCLGIVPDTPASCADRYIQDGETLNVGAITIKYKTLKYLNK